MILPVLAQSLSLGFAQVGLLRAVHSSAMWLLELPAGIAAERAGERRLLVFGLLMAGSGYLCLSLADTFTAVVLALLIAGCGAAFQHSLCSSLISKSFEVDGRRKALGVYNSSGDFGKLIFTALVSAFIGLGVHWQGIALGYGGFAILAGVVFWLVLRKANAGAPPMRRADHDATTEHSGWGIRHRMGFGSLAAIVFFDTMVQDGFLIFVTFLMLEKQVPTGLATVAVTLTLAGGTLGKLGGGMLANRIGPVRALVLVEMLTAMGILAALAAPSVWALVVLPLLGIVLQGSSTITYGAVSDFVHAERQSRGFAVIYTTGSCASVVGPITFGLIGQHYGLDSALVLMAMLVLIPVPIASMLHRAFKELAANR